jgi:hypothetical protein
MNKINIILISLILFLVLIKYRENFETAVKISYNDIKDLGSTGEKGEQGINGIVGPKGDRGEKGHTGSRGSMGSIGPRGYNGPRGIGCIFPKGSIVMWSGSVRSIPRGWKMCDGRNGTPDLRGRFILGANPTSGWQRPNTRGGSSTKRLSISEMPKHNHGGKTNTSGNHRHSGYTNYGGNHNHSWSASRQRAGTDDHNNTSELSKGDRSHSDVIRKTTNTTGNHRHSFTTNYGGNHNHTVGYNGSGRDFSIMPPFYTLFFIMKV